MRQNKIVRGLALALTCSSICFATSLAHVSANTVKPSAEGFSISNINPDTGKEFKNAYVKPNVSYPTSDFDYYFNHFLFQYGEGPGLHYEATTKSGGGAEVAVLNNYWRLPQNFPKKDLRTLHSIACFDTEGIKNLKGMIITYSNNGKVGGVFLPATGFINSNSDQNSGQVIKAYKKYGILGIYLGPKYVAQEGSFNGLKYNTNLQKAKGHIGMFYFTLDYQSMPFFLHPGNYINVYPVFNVGAGKGDAPVKNGNMTGLENANGIENVNAQTVFTYEKLWGGFQISPDAPNFPTPTESSSAESKV